MTQETFSKKFIGYGTFLLTSAKTDLSILILGLRICRMFLLHLHCFALITILTASKRIKYVDSPHDRFSEPGNKFSALNNNPDKTVASKHWSNGWVMPQKMATQKDAHMVFNRFCNSLDRCCFIVWEMSTFCHIFSCISPIPEMDFSYPLIFKAS